MVFAPPTATLSIGDLGIESVALSRQQQRAEITGFVRHEMMRVGALDENAAGVPWKKMHAICWERKVFWEGVPLDFDWTSVTKLSKETVGYWSLTSYLPRD